MRHIAIPAAAEDLGAKGFINRFSIGRRLALCFVGIFVLLFAVNGILLWQFHSAQVRADRRLTGVSLELIAALNLQSSLQSFNDRLDRVAQSRDAVLLRQESGSLRDMILDSVQDARNAITHLPPEVRLYPTFIPTIEVIESTLPSQLESLNSLAASGDWSALRLRLANEKQPLDAETSMLVKSITRDLNDTAGKLRSLYETLQESNTRFEEAQRITHVGYWEWDVLTDRVNWSDETYRIYGLRPQERPMHLATVREKIHPEDRGCVFRALEET